MLILDRALFEDKEVYILDEPERSLGNNFINDVVLPRINELAKLKKTIIIATHNANIAVRTLPFVSILKEYTNGEYNIAVPRHKEIKERTARGIMTEAGIEWREL